MITFKKEKSYSVFPSHNYIFFPQLYQSQKLALDRLPEESEAACRPKYI